MARQSISRLISARARAEPHRRLVSTDDGQCVLTAEQLDRAGNRLARDYRARGVRADDLVTIALPTSVEFVVACTAVWKLGATPQPMDPDIARSERAALERLDRPALAVGARPADTTIAWLPAGHRPDDTVSDSALPDASSACWKASTSSGSTGRPKVIRSTAPARFDPDADVAPFLPNRAVQLICGPLWHSATFTYAFRGLMTDHRLVLADGFDEHAFTDIVARERISWALLSPAMIHRLVRLPAAVLAAADTSSIRSVLHLGAPCPEDDKRALIDWLGAPRVHEVYAGSESNGLTMIDGSDWLTHPGSVGRPIGGTELSIRADDGSVVRPGVIGQIWMRRAGGARYTYVGHRSERTDDGWDTLGDMGTVDDDGFLTVVDRRTDTIRCGQRTIYPARMEQAIIAHPAIRDAVVYAVHDETGAQTVSAVLDIADSDADPDEIEHFALGHLAAVCRPGRVRVARRPLRNAAGKVRRSSFATAGAGIVPGARET
ncbi:AMP-binding protein [Williamsia phyllosphaerae]|uniref:AMP-dependent synthetase n=1 Tax=Williamsia phyllosphaerae TaxID=885042 RepID=A0ABQ1V7F2_9NOCA|nr:AMP-binding protein [Williamsia phyllosphaerae]GGF42205.1 AMP-dependent synthetase [Williamsia phyllosphaerae]